MHVFLKYHNQLLDMSRMSTSPLVSYERERGANGWRTLFFKVT